MIYKKIYQFSNEGKMSYIRKYDIFYINNISITYQRYIRKHINDISINAEAKP